MKCVKRCPSCTTRRKIMGCTGRRSPTINKAFGIKGYVSIINRACVRTLIDHLAPLLNGTASMGPISSQVASAFCLPGQGKC